jgi:predicted dehydrogenase
LLERLIPLGKPILCEKPLVTDAEDARALATLLASHGTPLCSGWFQPFLPEMLAIRMLLAEGACGTLTRVRFRNAHHAAYGRWFDSDDLRWFTEAELAGGGAFMDMGAHAVHLLRFLFGPVDAVWATIANHSGEYPAVDDHGLAVLRFANGLHGQVEAAWTQTGGPGGLEVVGSTGTIHQVDGGYVLSRPGLESEPILPAAPEPDRVERLLAICRGELSAEDLAHDLAATIDEAVIMAACYRSNDTATWQSC